MKRILCLLFSLSLALLLPLSAGAAESDSFTFFEGTQYPLRAYFLRGDAPGPTVMVQGGIQGDELSGFITAQLLTRANVRTGSLIIVPRANEPSIQQRKRQVNVDLNRRFDQEYGQFYEDRLARVIRFLVNESDAFIHLHEGSGFYSPTDEGPLRNPRRYGQSVIIDASVYGGRLHLAEEVKGVLDALNRSVSPAAYQFRLFDMNTFAPDTGYAEQRRSLTYYALRSRGIPALAIEVSKDIKSLSWKVKHQLLAVKLFLEHFGVVVDLPQVSDQDLDLFPKSEPRLVVNGMPLSLTNPRPISLNPASRLKVSVEGAKPFESVPSVFASDRYGVNLLGTPRIPLHAFNSLEVRIDGENMGRVPVRFTDIWPKPSGDKPVFAVWLNGELRKIQSGSTLEARVGDQLILEGIWGSSEPEILNFKGAAGGAPRAGSNQDIGKEIVLEPENPTDSRQGGGNVADQGWEYAVVRETPGKTKASFTLRVSPRRVASLSLKDSAGKPVSIPWQPDGHATLPPGEYTLEGVSCNGPRDKILAIVGGRPLRFRQRFALKEKSDLSLRLATTFAPLGQMTLDVSGSLAQGGRPVTASLQ